MVSEESLNNGLLPTLASVEVVEEGNNSTSVLSASTKVVGRERKGTPEDLLANIDSSEKRDTSTETIALVKDFVHQDNKDTSTNKLKDEKNNRSSAELRGGTVETRENNSNSLGNGEQDSQQLLGRLEKLTIRLQIKVDSQGSRTTKQLEDQAGSDDGRSAQLHQSAP